MMNSALVSGAAAVWLFMSSVAGAQSVATGDSVARRVAPNATDSVRLALRDGDYARLTIAHPLGLDVRVLRPGGDYLRLFATPDVKGSTPIAFIAEGAGDYIIAAKNTGEALVQYGLKFVERMSLDERTRPAPVADAYTSPRIEALRRRVEGGDTSTAQFWSQLGAEGTPIVEPLDAKYDLVTFVWRTQYDTRSVHLRAPFVLVAPTNGLFRLMPRTDVWYLTEKIPKGARFSYQIEPNRSTVERLFQVSAQLDPLNRGPRRSCPAGTSKFRCRSMVELADARPEPWRAARPSVPQGKVEKHSIQSAVQQVTREVTVYTPAGFSRAGKALPLVVLFDGPDFLYEEWSWYGLEMWSNLIAEKRVSPMVIVMVHNLPGRRVFDLVANEKFGRFVATELVPWARREYSVSREARQTVVGGASAGGFAATYLGLMYPEVFGNVLSMSGAFWWSPEHNGGQCAGVCPDSSGRPEVENSDATTEPNWLAQLALRRPASKTRFYLSAGTFEVDLNGEGAGILEENRHLRDILRAKGVDVIFNQFVGGHEQVVWRGALADGLQKLLPHVR